MRNLFAIVLVIIFALVFIDIVEPTYGFFGKVDAGNVGIVTHFGQIQEETLQSGFHAKSFFSRINQVSVRTRREQIELVAFSADIQQVGMLVTINFNITPDIASTLFRTVGMNYVDTIIIPRINENAKVVASKYSAESIIANREILSTEILALMQEDLSDYGITVTSISIENIDFTDAFESAVEAKQVATQTKLTAQTEQDRITMEAKASADRKRIEAEAAAEVQKINADAEAYAIQARADAEAEANRKISETLTAELIDYTKAQLWNGQLPSTYIGGDDAVPIISVPVSGQNGLKDAR